MTVYSQLDRLTELGLPTYVALPWKRTDDHDRLRDHHGGRVDDIHDRRAGALE